MKININKINNSQIRGTFKHRQNESVDSRSCWLANSKMTLLNVISQIILKKELKTHCSIPKNPDSRNQISDCGVFSLSAGLAHLVWIDNPKSR